MVSGPTGKETEPPVSTDDSLRTDPGDRFDVVMTNLPFGKKSSVLVVNEEGESEREALTVVFGSRVSAVTDGGASVPWPSVRHRVAAPS
jgi:hypothetical protein